MSAKKIELLGNINILTTQIIICKNDYLYMISEYNNMFSKYNNVVKQNDILCCTFTSLMMDTKRVYETNIEVMQRNKLLSDKLQNVLREYKKLVVVEINKIYNNELLNYNYLLNNINRIIDNSYTSIDTIKYDLNILKEICEMSINNIHFDET